MNGTEGAGAHIQKAYFFVKPMSEIEVYMK
jgi:hypothetical protein